MSAIAVVEDEVRELVRRRGLDPVADPAAVRRLVDEVIAEYDDRSLTGSLPQLADPRLAARQVSWRPPSSAGSTFWWPAAPRPARPRCSTA